MLIDFFFTLRAAKLKVSVKEYLPLLEAIEAGDPDLASARFMAHVDLARDRVAEYIETHPDIW